MTGRKWNKALTYEPKIKACRNGECRQTIRPNHTVKPGDWISLHGWQGRPYWSSWSWRTDYTPVKEVIYIWVWKSCWAYKGMEKHPFYWHDHPRSEALAESDFIDPPTGKALGELMNGKYKLPSYQEEEGNPMQIIRWMRQNHPTDFRGPGESAYSRISAWEEIRKLTKSNPDLIYPVLMGEK